MGTETRRGDSEAWESASLGGPGSQVLLFHAVYTAPSQGRLKYPRSAWSPGSRAPHLSLRLSASLPQVLFSFGLNILSLGLNISLFGTLFGSNMPIYFPWKVSGASLHCAWGLLAASEEPAPLTEETLAWGC